MGINGISNVSMDDLVVGDLVSVMDENGHGQWLGCGRVINIGADGSSRYEVRLLINGERLCDMSRESLIKCTKNHLLELGNTEHVNALFRNKFSQALNEFNTIESLDNDQSSTWVRRSSRYYADSQFSCGQTKVLMELIENNSPKIEILRLKNYLHANCSKQTMFEVIDAIEKSTVVQALYIQNFEEAMDDDCLEKLVNMLQKNLNIWSLNVGENFKITKKGWESFAKALENTHITHMYAGSETTVHGDLKNHMRDVIRANRSKHSKHIDKTNLKVIRQIGQMWWNPRNANCLMIKPVFKRKARSGGRKPNKKNKTEDDASRKLKLLGSMVVIPSEDEGKWYTGAILDYDQETGLFLVADYFDKNFVLMGDGWIDLQSSQGFGLCSCVLAVPGDRLENADDEVEFAYVQKECLELLNTLWSFQASETFRFKKNKWWRRTGYDEFLESSGKTGSLSTVRKNLQNGVYSSNVAFRDSVLEIFDQFLEFFKDDDSISFSDKPLRKWAKELRTTFEDSYQERIRVRKELRKGLNGLEPCFLFVSLDHFLKTSACDAAEKEYKYLIGGLDASFGTYCPFVHQGAKLAAVYGDDTLLDCFNEDVTKAIKHETKYLKNRRRFFGSCLNSILEDDIISSVTTTQ